MARDRDDGLDEDDLSAGAHSRKAKTAHPGAGAKAAPEARAGAEAVPRAGARGRCARPANDRDHGLEQDDMSAGIPSGKARETEHPCAEGGTKGFNPSPPPSREQDGCPTTARTTGGPDSCTLPPSPARPLEPEGRPWGQQPPVHCLLVHGAAQAGTARPIT